MDWQETLYRWEEYSEKLYPLRDEVAYIFETKCFYDDNWEYQERLYEADDDTVFLMKLSGMLNEICDFVKSHIEVLSHRVKVDEEIRDNVEHAFEAWKRGLCPKLMRNVPHYVLSDKCGWDSFWETYDEVYPAEAVYQSGGLSARRGAQSSHKVRNYHVCNDYLSAYYVTCSFCGNEGLQAHTVNEALRNWNSENFKERHCA